MSTAVLPPRATVAGDGSTAVARTVPQKGHLSVGPWWFVDAFGPGTGSAPWAGATPHGHAGMQSMTWLFDGALRHTDGLGTRADIVPGHVLMLTAGDGVVHAEESIGDAPPAGVALGLVLPAAERHRAASVEEFAPEPVRFGDHEVAIFVGELGWEDSPVEVFCPAAGTEVRFASHDPLQLAIPHGWEFGILALDEPLTVEGVAVPPGHLAVVAGQDSLSVSVGADAGHVVRALVLGGEVPEPFVPWWNFVAGDHDEVVAWRAAYEEARAGGSTSFAPPPGVDPGSLVAAPPLPSVRLLPKHRSPA